MRLARLPGPTIGVLELGDDGPQTTDARALGEDLREVARAVQPSRFGDEREDVAGEVASEAPRLQRAIGPEADAQATASVTWTRPLASLGLAPLDPELGADVLHVHEGVAHLRDVVRSHRRPSDAHASNTVAWRMYERATRSDL
jgi:hypothetical protein